MNGLKIYSFFAGSGFLDLGFEMSGFRIEFVNEISSSFIKAYQYSRKKMGLLPPTYGYANADINKYLHLHSLELSKYVLESREDGSIVGFIGGPPCPDFSIAGTQQGKNGDNGKLSLSYIELIIAQRPDFFLYENVKGLWRTAKHRAFFDELKTRLSEADYCMTDRLTNSIEFGAPQDRDRILLFGVSKRVLDAYGLSIADFPWEKYTTNSLKTSYKKSREKREKK